MTTPSLTFDYSALSPSERLALAQDILDSVLDEQVPLTAAQIADVESKLHDIDSGKEMCESWDSVRERLLGELK